MVTERKVGKEIKNKREVLECMRDSPWELSKMQEWRDSASTKIGNETWVCLRYCYDGDDWPKRVLLLAYSH